MNDLFEKCGKSASVSVINDIDRYDQMCFDACQDLQDLARKLKKQL